MSDKLGYFEIRKHQCTCESDSPVGCRCGEKHSNFDFCFFAYDEERIENDGDTYWPDATLTFYEDVEEYSGYAILHVEMGGSLFIGEPEFVADLTATAHKIAEGGEDDIWLQYGDIIGICRERFDEGRKELLYRRQLAKVASDLNI